MKIGRVKEERLTAKNRHGKVQTEQAERSEERRGGRLTGQR